MDKIWIYVWKQRKLGDVFKEYSEKNHAEQPALTIMQGEGTIKREDSERNLLYNKSNLSSYKMVYQDDFIVHLRSFEGGLEKASCNGIVSPAYHIFHGEKADSRFYYSYFRSYEFIKRKLVPHIYGIRDGRSIDIAGMKTIEIPYPSFEEQQRIGDYLDLVNNLITFHHRKLNILNKICRYAWEQRKFADFTWDAGKRNKEDLDLEPYAITNEHGFIRQCDAHDDFGYMKDTDRKAYNIVQPNSFAYNPARINVGSIGYYKGMENVIVSSLYEVFQTDNYVNDGFLWHWFKSDEFPRWIERLQEGSVRLYFYYDKLCECQLYMPLIEEQEKIASFLDTLDHLITLHRRKYKQLQIIRKFMLQNIFL